MKKNKIRAPTKKKHIKIIINNYLINEPINKNKMENQNQNKQDQNKKNAWEILGKILRTILTLGIEHLINFLKKKK